MKERLDIRQSTFFAFQDCKRKFLLSEIVKLPEAENSNLRSSHLGTFIHSAILTQYAGGSISDGVQLQRAAFLSEGKDPEQVNDATSLSASVAEGYFRWVKRESLDDELGQPAMVEERLEMKVGEDSKRELWITGQADLVFPSLLVDLKTKARIEAANPVLGINPQLLTYLILIWKNTDLRPQLAEHRNLVRKAPTDRSKAPLFGVDRIYATEALLATHWAHMQSIGKEILQFFNDTEGWEAGDYPHKAAPPHPTNDCSWKCPFVNQCPSIDKQATVFQSLISKPDLGGLFT